jgi:hypothetical protein
VSEPRWAQRIPTDPGALQRAAIADEIFVEEPAAAPVKGRRRRISRRRLLRNGLVVALLLAGLLAIGLGLVIVVDAEGRLRDGLDVRTRNGWVLVAGGIVSLFVAGFLPMLFPRRRRVEHGSGGLYLPDRLVGARARR